uniref:Serpin domain-containing protein n=1 Tax=Panagrolaimus superbus TaxID=310955 RepID=A0A914ZBH3_9BILA
MGDFAMNILRSLMEKEISVTVSPVSISCALALCLLGANGETEKQINDVIDKGLSNTKIHRKFSQIISTAFDLNVKIVNTLYVSKSISLMEAYKNDVKEFYNGNYEIVDFSNGIETAKKINDMVATVTNQKIKKIVDAKKFSGTTAVTIINAIYLEKLWQYPFTLMRRKVVFYFNAEKCEEVCGTFFGSVFFELIFYIQSFF